MNSPPERPGAAHEPLSVLDSSAAGGMAIRGGLIRTAGYLVGAALTAGASVFLLRHLGVVDAGRYITVMSLLAIVSGLADAGLGVVGNREYVNRASAQERRELLGGLLGMRLATATTGVAAAALFGVVAGYGSTLVIGTLVAGIGVILASASSTLTVPLASSLRQGAVTVIEVSQRLTMVAGFAVLVILSAELSRFFVVPLAAGLVALLVTTLAVGRASSVRPRFAREQWAEIAREVAPVAAAVVVQVIYIRALVVLISLVEPGIQTGLYATSTRILELVAAVPLLAVSASFPIMARAGATDEERLAGALQRTGQATLLLVVLLILGLAIAADPIVRLLGGDEYAPAAPVLRIQAFALLGAGLTPVWTLGLIAIRRQRPLAVINAVALVTVVGLGLALIPALGARGAALAAAIGEAALAVLALVMLARARPGLRPRLGYLPRTLAAGGLGALAVLIPGLPDVAQALLATTICAGVAWALGVVPGDILRALLRRGAPAGPEAPQASM